MWWRWRASNPRGRCFSRAVPRVLRHPQVKEPVGSHPAGFCLVGVALRESVEVVEAVRPVCCAMRAFAALVQLLQVFAAFSDVFGRAPLVTATPVGPDLATLQRRHALAEILKFGLDFGGHGDLREQ